MGSGLALLLALLVFGVLRLRMRRQRRHAELLVLRRANVELAQRLERLEGERALAASHAQAARERTLSAARASAEQALRQAEQALHNEHALFASGPVRRFGFGLEPPYRLRPDLSGSSQAQSYTAPANGLSLAFGEEMPAPVADGRMSGETLLAWIDTEDHATLAACVEQARAEPGLAQACELRVAGGSGERRLLQLRVDPVAQDQRVALGYWAPLHEPHGAAVEPQPQARSDDLQNLVRTMSAGQRFMESLQQLTELLQQCETRGQGLDVIAQGGPALFPRWDGAICVADDDGSAGIAARWGEFFETERGKAADCWAVRRNRVHVTGADGATRRVSPVCGHFGSGSQLPPGMTHAICVPLMAPSQPPVLLHLVTHAPLDEDALATATWAGETLSHALELSLVNLDLRVSLREQAVRDAMTGLFNRRHFDQVMALEISRAERSGGNLVLALFDIDHFKTFNDTFGHEAGDEVIKAVAHELLGFVRSYDTACRVGGEELTVLLPNARLEESSARLEHLREQIAALHLTHDERALDTVTVSIGVADLESGPHETLLRRADMALYAAKRSGRNRLVCWRADLPDVTDFAPLVRDSAEEAPLSEPQAR
ncbi:MAG: GGDEF domain-containing protein [Methylibium sp.]|uniref:GGDEF domain-containing protein n=1 Tax=Methylibium sp. TaxID=2067992 RepID=UPI0017CEA1DA|nr:GGDEF domain-containing protein [Methylibium sp.]MBA3596645.1 GGDEF domain-containing protein [Methylibium sp.]